MGYSLIFISTAVSSEAVLVRNLSVLLGMAWEVEAITKASTILADISILFATWRVSGNIRALARRFSRTHASLTDVLLTDGKFS